MYLCFRSDASAFYSSRIALNKTRKMKILYENIDLMISLKHKIKFTFILIYENFLTNYYITKM